MTSVETPQTRCLAAIARCDITPPVGIYHRMWGAATHDRATGVHKPLLATLLWLEPLSGEIHQALLVAALDHCILDQPDIELMQRSMAAEAGVQQHQVLVSLAHTHAAGLMSRSRAALPGGEFIGPYLDDVAAKLGRLASEAKAHRQPATILYATGRCNLAANRDFFDAEHNQFVCGFNPDGLADDTLLVAKIVADNASLIATIVNYACHPTTLAWQNMLISPDYVGALRETVEQHAQAPCLFLQGASGDLGPREGFVGDPATADKNGRQVAFAALAALESLPPPHTHFTYSGPVVSGATIGTWRHERLNNAEIARSSAWNIQRWQTPLAYRQDLPTTAQTQADLGHWQAEEQRLSAAGDSTAARDAHARAERAQRQLWRLQSLPPESFPLDIMLAHLGDASWLFVPGEHYQTLQTTLRAAFPNLPLLVATLTGGWQPGYIPPASTYGRGIYQEQIAVVAAGSAEAIIAAVRERLAQLL
jgi:hypothetical protein